MNASVSRILFRTLYQHENVLNTHPKFPCQECHSKRLKPTLSSQQEIRPHLLLRFIGWPSSERQLQNPLLDIIKPGLLEKWPHFWRDRERAT